MKLHVFVHNEIVCSSALCPDTKQSIKNDCITINTEKNV